jgi:hypothetical protein
MGERGLDSSGSGYETVVSSCVQDNEYYGSIKGGGFLDWVTISFSGRTVLCEVSSLE